MFGPTPLAFGLLRAPSRQLLAEYPQGVTKWVKHPRVGRGTDLNTSFTYIRFEQTPWLTRLNFTDMACHMDMEGMHLQQSLFLRSHIVNRLTSRTALLALHNPLDSLFLR